MSDPSAGYSRGYLATPMVEACQQRGLFGLLDIDEYRERKWLLERLGANEGYFGVALELLESLGLIETNVESAVRRTRKADDYVELGLASLYAVAPERLIRDASHARMLGKKIEAIFFRAAAEDSAWLDLARGSIVVPLVVALQAADAETLAEGLDGPVRELLVQQGWLADNGAGLTVSGSALFQRGAFEVAASYRPVLKVVPELLFGDHAQALREIRDRRRILNCETVAADLQQEIVDIFNREPLESQPRAVVDVNCGDGVVLEEVLRTISSRTVRGRHLANMPVRLVVGVDEHQHDLEGAADVLVLRRFVDFLVEADATRPVNEALLDATTVLTCWQQHLRSVAQSAGHSRLLIAEAHGSNVDWMDRLTHEYPITAEAFITLAATVGLFNDDGVKRFPRTTSPCRISLHSMTRRDYIVRHATQADLERLCELEQLCWQHTQTPVERICSRLETYSQGQFVLERDSEVLGVIYSQRIGSTDALMARTAADVHELHDASGSIIQLLAVNIDPRAQNAGYGDQLLEFMLQRCSLMTGIEQVAAVTLCKNYDSARSRSFADYIQQQGSNQDSVLAFHQAHGAEVVKVVPGYRPQDHANLNNGVLVAYDILNRAQRRQRLKAEASVATAADAGVARLGRAQIARFVEREAAQLLGIGESELDIDRPVMEMGLDSADLLKLQRLCEERFGLQLEAGFFFEHSTIAKVVDYVTIRLAATPEEASVARAVSHTDAARRPGSPGPQAGADRADPIAATDIAIVGMSCKLPGGIDTPEHLWRVLASNECVIGPFPKARRGWPNAAEYPGIDQGGFVNDFDAFDAAFFRISPAEAQITDPQQRVLLELAWACLEDAGILPSALKGSSTGVFVGASNCDYSRLVQEAGLDPEAHYGAGSSLAILANRVSYFFDLSGPSLVVDTACSSSLVALHSAVQSLRLGECVTALVGGVNLICHPDLSIAYHKGGMLARDGRCKVFDAKADGYARSEGAVVLLLKPLHAAVADHNQIHAVIRGSAINHGGLAGGLTVPNPQKQRELLIAAWKDAGIAAQDLTYIEAHGTGTPLGDPIELQGIQEAYAQHGGAILAKPCAIGSVKSNVGHLEPAAGITGLLKIILSFQHQQLPASVNFTELNPRIRLTDTPFFIQDRLRDWDADRPRVAAVSSFGSGGTNAHVVVQEYSGGLSSSWAADEYLFVLSAANQDRLHFYVGQVINWLEREVFGADLFDAIFTWQVGRTAMRHRLAIKVKDHVDLLNKLRSWFAGNSDAPDVWSGQVVQKDSNITRAWQTKSGRQLIDHALFERDLEPLGALWTSGTDIDWRKYYEGVGSGERKPKIVSLPTYPFARERYWIELAATRQGGAVGNLPYLGNICDRLQRLQCPMTGVLQPLLHPLLHTNSSDLSQQSYSATFSGEEFFLSDHQVRGDGGTVQKVLPGVAYLEMARAAIERALPALSESVVLELRNTVWVQPIVVTEKKQVSIALMAVENDQIDYEIYSQDTEQEIVHCKGRAVLSRQPAPVRLEIEELKKQMGQGPGEPSSAYAGFGRMGLLYGPSFQGITAIHRGSDQVLARLRLPSIVEDTSGDYVLHPSLMDGAVQAAVGLIDGWSERSNRPRLPFALETLRIISPCTPEMVAWVRYAPGSQAGDNVLKVDIDLCDELGNVCVQMHGLSSRLLSKEIKTSAAQGKAAGSLLAIPVWRAGEVEGFAGASKIHYAEHHVVLCELSKVNVEELRAWLPQSQCSSLQALPQTNIAQRYNDFALACFERIRAILQGKPQGKVLVQIVVADGPEQAMLAGLSGLLKTASLENPRLIGQLILVSDTTMAGELAERLQAEKTFGLEALVKYEQGARLVLRWQDVSANPETLPIGFKDHGIYLITGGLGGLGVLFAKEILAQTRYARVVLTGRSAFNAGKQSHLDKLSEQAGRLSYRQVDIGNLDQVKRLIVSIRDELGQLNGILHSAGMTADNFILKKASAEFSQVLVPKVTGTFNLDLASQDVELDFFVVFSSIAGALGNLGQADYATANGFMDQFAAYRNGQVAARQRYGRTRSINWPLWQSGGMKMDLASQELLQETTGLLPMRTGIGMHAFHHGLALPYSQILVVEGDLARIRQTLLDGPVVSGKPQAELLAVADEAEPEALAEKTQEYLRKQCSSVLKLPSQKIDPLAALEDYGIDSMLAMKLTSQLEETFGSLSKTLFFEYRTIRELTTYFVSNHSSQLNTLFAMTTNRTSEATPVAAQAIPPPPTASISTRRFSRPPSAAPGPAKELDAIAIIGLSGRYPEAVDIDAYWNNLREGKDCIIEVPRERWDWRKYFSEDRNSSGRHYSKWGGFIAGVDEFDPLFFNIAPREAKFVDPQERLFLQHVWMAIEDAGYNRASLVPSEQDLAGQVGVYVGVMWGEYQLFGAEANLQDLRMAFSGNLASIANRVSYTLNLHGPSMTLDSMCSSSLTAIHVACQDLRLGQTSLAIAGGVNVSIHPNKYLMLSLGQFISSDGHCQSFGEGGDGYIPGEGVGVVVLKRLSEARRDGDHIYGIIRGSALTHGGKTNGYTVPNPQAQAGAISRALAESHTDARHVSYVEAHGTGTRLGDPIEIAALSKAFHQYTQDTGFCRIGSAKSNIGHCESAAGIAGLTKVLLQMQHQQIVPSLHSAQLNPYIDFAKSPFVVNQALRHWEQPVIDGRKLPRIAGISSFGAGGSNAHMIVEEYQAPSQPPMAVANVAILLSARTAEQLQQKAIDLWEFIRPRLTTIDLVAMAYTLQVGREAMEERLAFVVSSVGQLAEKLQAYVAGEQEIEDAYYGQVKRNKEALAVFGTDVDLQQTVDKWIANRRLFKLLDLWVKGLELDWSKLYGESRPQRISLPTYPFAKERYWIDLAASKNDPATGPGTSVLHPLLHSNTSDLTEQSYRSTFTGEELFIAEHQGQKVLPAVACLEMARAAIEHAMPARPESAVLELRNTVWAQPIVVSENRPVSIALLTVDSEQIDYEIFSHDADQEIVHCQGRAVLSREPAPARLDLERLKAQGQRLVHLRADVSGAYVLHPTLMDGALKAAVGLIDGSPFALELLRIVSPCTPEMVAWVRYSPGSQAEDDVVRLDIDLCDGRGDVAVQMRGLSWQQALLASVEPAIEEPAAPVLMRKEIVFLAARAIAAPVERRRAATIALAAPGASATSPPSSTGRARITLSNASLSVPAPGRATPAVSPVRLYDCGNGIFSLEIAASRSKDIIAHVLQALDWVQQDVSSKVLMLGGIEHCFVRGGRDEYQEAVERKLFQRLVSFAYPVVALLQGDVIGAGFLGAALCDFMVCNEDAHYGYTDAEHHFYPTTAETILFSERFGEVRAHDFLYVSMYSTGRQLRAEGWTCPILPWAQVEAHAQQLASTLATKSRDALRLLKEHLTRRMVDLVDALTRVEVAKAATEEHPSSEPVLVIRYGKDGLRDQLADLPRCKAIVLVGEDPDIPDEVVIDLQRLLLESEIPAVAALTGNARGNAWLVSQFCDASVYSETGVYSSATIGQNLAQTAVAVFAHRFGSEAANEILLTGADYSGVDLRQRVGALSVAEHDRVLPAAVQLAESWARMPRATLAAWKKQTATSLQDEIRNLRSLVGWEQQDETQFAAPEPIALQSRVVTLTVHPEGIVVVKMEDREAKNMFSDALVDGVREVFAHIEQTPAYKVVILTGYDSYFASGGTKENLLAIHEGKVKFTDLGIFHVALDCKLPVIAAMQGHGIGAGWCMGMFADIALLSDESRYVSPYMNYGFTPGAGATYILADKMGPDLARESLLTAHQYAGRELKERGLTLRVLPRVEVAATAMALAKQVARLSRGRLIGLKRQLTAHMHQPLDETYRRELAMHEETFVGRSDTLAQIQSKFHDAAEMPPVGAQEVPVETPTAREESLAEIAGPNIPSGDGDPLRAVTASLRTLLSNELLMRESDIDDGALFVDLGLDSISGVTWIRKINEKFQTSLEATNVYSYPSLSQLSRYVKAEAETRGTLPSVGSPASADIPAASLKSTPPPQKSTTTPRKHFTTHETGKLTSLRGQTASRFTSGPVTRLAQPIAIIGMAGQFPQGKSLEEFWQNIAEGRNCITRILPKRWDVDTYYRPGDAVAGKTNCQWAGSLDEFDLFDPLFFNISPTEAESMDPQQRLFLQACWHSIENAGYDARALSGSRCGVFVGCTAGDYHRLSREHQLSAQGFTGSATSILAARISYFLNLQGPCVSIDTACSSSLVSIAQACDSLTSGASDLALAGGVYVMTGPEMHIKTAQAGMLSPDGRCFTFDQRANGFVPGEGVGVLLLKRLAEAQRDQDIIHAVIQGWGVNQDGKSNGITAPNPESQTRLEQEVYDKFQIDPANLQLIEAHGTGTKLGDPIEVEGLKKAFTKYTENKEYCALGSVKSNIGHCLTAAGVAGVLKLVLALKHKQLPPTINFEQLNEHIALKDSPFYVNSRLREWESGAARVRQAAISALGFSGTNAHMVIGEYLPPAEVKRPVTVVSQDTKIIVPLSAKTAEQLAQKARDLSDFIRCEAPSIDLIEMAYTLQVGREAMDERLGVLVSSVEQLGEKLDAYVNGEPRIENLYRGQAKSGTESTSIISQDDDVKDTIVEKWIAKRKLSKLLELWVNGLELDWSKLYGEVKPQRITLPTYPFAKERYWIDTASGEPDAARGTSSTSPATAVLHPLLHWNTSDLSGQRYSTTFTGDEFFLTDHRVRTDGNVSRKVLPGVAYLEMARAAIAQASPIQEESSILELHGTVWLKPMVVSEPTRVSIGLSADDAGRVAYEIYGMDGEHETVYCEGQALFSREAAPARLDMERLRGRMDRDRWEGPDVYAIFTKMGLDYGAAHQGITSIALGENQLLAQLRLPAIVEASQHEYVLHPSLMDSALQASIGLIASNHVPTSPFVPFAVETLRIVSACTEEMLAWVRYSKSSKPDDDTVTVDIDLCDRQGNVCVQMLKFALRVLDGEAKSTHKGNANHALNRGETRDHGSSSPSDRSFYERLILDVVNRKVSVDEAVEVG